MPSTLLHLQLALPVEKMISLSSLLYFLLPFSHVYSSDKGLHKYLLQFLLQSPLLYRKSRHEIFREFASLLEKYKSSIINSFIMVEKIGNGRIYDSRLSNGPIESINRKIKDLKRLGRGFRNFEHFRNRFLYATRSVPVLNDITNYNPVLYLEEDDF